jgi:hypothetical protein
LARWLDHYRPEDDLRRRLVERAVLATIVLERIAAIDEAAWAEASRSGRHQAPEVWGFVARFDATWSRELHRALKALGTARPALPDRVESPAPNEPTEEAPIDLPETDETGRIEAENGRICTSEANEVSVQISLKKPLAAKIPVFAWIAASFVVGAVVGVGNPLIPSASSADRSPDFSGIEHRASFPSFVGRRRGPELRQEVEPGADHGDLADDDGDEGDQERPLARLVPQDPHRQPEKRGQPEKSRKKGDILLFLYPDYALPLL